MHLQQPFQLAPDVGFAHFVHFVDDQDLRREAEMAQRLVLHRQDRKQGLIDRADADIREEGAAPAFGKPIGAAGCVLAPLAAADEVAKRGGEGLPLPPVAADPGGGTIVVGEERRLGQLPVSILLVCGRFRSWRESSC